MPTYLPIRYPLFWEELRRRLRGGRMQVVVLVYTLLLMALLFFVTQMNSIGENPREWARFGKELWQIFVLAQMVIIIILSPGLTAGAISLEKEQGTLDLLILTRMSSLSIVLGKFFGAIGQMLFLLLAGLPIISVVFFFGGVSPWDIALGYTLTIATGLGYAALGFLMSCWCKRVIPAVAWAYALMLLLAVILPIIPLVLEVIAHHDFSDLTVFIFIMSNPAISYFGVFMDHDFSFWSREWEIVPTFLIMIMITMSLLASSTLMLRRLRGLSSPFTFTKLKRLIMVQWLDFPEGVRLYKP